MNYNEQSSILNRSSLTHEISLSDQSSNFTADGMRRKNTEKVDDALDGV